jgi:hypothetical protein
MVSERDAVIVNWGYGKYNILREKKPVDMVSRVQFDYKDFTWDLVLREDRRWYHMRMVPPCLFVYSVGSLAYGWYCNSSGLGIINSMGHVSFLFFLAAPWSMLINGRAFEGTCDYEITDRQLTECTGTTIPCIPTSTPVVFPHAEVVFKLLLVLYRYQLCCFLTGTYDL